MLLSTAILYTAAACGAQNSGLDPVLFAGLSLREKGVFRFSIVSCGYRIRESSQIDCGSVCIHTAACVSLSSSHRINFLVIVAVSRALPVSTRYNGDIIS